MKMSMQRTLFEIINVLLALLLVIPLGVLFEQLCGYPLYRCCLIPCLSLIGFFLGRYSMTKPMNVSIALSIVSLVSASVLALILCPGLTLVTLLTVLLTAFFSVFFFFSARKAGYTVYAPMITSGILLHILVLIFCTGLQWPDNAARFTSLIAVLFFLLALFAFSAKGLRKSMHKTSGDRRVIYPAGIQMGNFLLVTGFILVAAFLSNIYPIFYIFSRGFKYVIQALIAFFGFFSGLFTRRTVGTDIEEAAASESIAEDSILNAEPKGEASWITTGVEIFAFLLVMAFVVYALYKLIQKIRKSGTRLPGFLRNLRDKFAPVAEEDYIDETESLFDAKQLLSDAGARMKGALHKLRERPQKIDDFPDNRMKVRFVFQQLLKRVKTRDPSAAAKTPNEIYSAEYPGEEDFREFMDYYNEAKYSKEDVPDDAVNCAREILKQKL